MIEDSVNWRDWSRSRQAMLYVIATLEDLQNKGLVTGPLALTPKAREAVAEMKAAHFTPTEDEINESMSFLASPHGLGAAMRASRATQGTE